MLFIFLSFFTVRAWSLDLTSNVDPANLTSKYGVEVRFLSKEAIAEKWNPNLLAKKAYAIVEGPAEVQVFDAKTELYALTQSRIVFVRKSLGELAGAADPMAAPYPPPIFDPRNISSTQVNESHRYTLFNFLYKQKVSIVTVAANCQAATHYLTSQKVAELQVQTLVKDCFDPGDSEKLVFREAIQTTDLVAIDSNVTALLLRNFVLSKRNRFGLIKPSPEDLKNASIDMSNTTLQAVLAKIGISAEFEVLFQPAMQEATPLHP